MKTISQMMMLIFSVFCVFQGYTQNENPAVISADKMNVFYRGIDNPVSIAIPGIPSEKIKVSASSGTLTGENGKYVIRDISGENVTISVMAEVVPGQTRKYGNFVFRVLAVPAPEIRVGSLQSTGLFVTREALLKNPEVNVFSPLPIDIKFEIVSFSFIQITKGDVVEMKVNGNKFSGEILQVIRKLEAGDQIFIDDIRVQGPGGERTLPAIRIQIVAGN